MFMNVHSEQIDLITAALAKAQSEIENPSKESRNPHFKSSYADLANVLEVCREPLSKNGLCIAQPLSFEGDKIFLVTILSHTSGQWMKSFIPLPIQKPGSQEIGSCITYMRRYSLSALVGIFQEDDDAEIAEGRESDRATIPEEDPTKISSKQKGLLSGLLSQLNDGSYATKVCAKLKISDIYEIPRHKFSELIDHLKSLIREKSNAA
jgi:ERF superfamily